MFAITKDHIADETQPKGTNSNAVGVVGPRSAQLSYDDICCHPQGKKFRMKDDDGELYYEGVYVATTRSDEFQPLDCFGEPNAGATIIEYWDNGWKAI